MPPGSGVQGRVGDMQQRQTDAECMHVLVWARKLASVLMGMFWNGELKNVTELQWGERGREMRGGILKREVAEWIVGMVEGVTWRSMFLWVPPRRVFGMVAAFTLMMQFQRLPASRRRRVFLCHHRVGLYQCVSAGPAEGIRVPQSLLTETASCNSHFSLTPTVVRRLPQFYHGNFTLCLRKAKPIYCGGGEVEDGGGGACWIMDSGRRE